MRHAARKREAKTVRVRGKDRKTDGQTSRDRQTDRQRCLKVQE